MTPIVGSLPWTFKIPTLNIVKEEQKCAIGPIMEPEGNIWTLEPNLLCSIHTVLGNDFKMETAAFNSSGIIDDAEIADQMLRCRFKFSNNLCHTSFVDLKNTPGKREI